MKSKSLLLISNAVLVLLVGVLIGIFYSFNSTPHIINYVILLLTLCTPSIYLLIISKTNPNPELSNLTTPSLIGTHWTVYHFCPPLYIFFI